MKKSTQQLVEKLKTVMKVRTSKKKAILQKDLADELGVSERYLRIIIHDVRSQNPFGSYYLVSNHEVGFWLSDNQKEIEKWVNGYMSKALSILPVVRVAKKFCSHKFSEQIGTLFSLKKDIELQNKFAHAIIPAGNKTGKEKIVL